MKDEADKWRRDNPKDETLEVDKDDEDTENEIGPDCYPLDFGIMGLARSRLWIRNDYIRIYNRCEGLYNDVEHDKSGIAPSIVITGQPGIGKSFS
jgi:hypothetical protein